jgi:hypothetical protein
MANIPSSSPGQASFSIEKWQPKRSGKLYGFVTVRISGLRIDGIKIFEGKDGDAFAAMPSSSWTTRDGKVKYAPIVEFLDKGNAKRFSDALVRKLAAMEPGLFAPDGDATVTQFDERRRTDESRNFAQRRSSTGGSFRP